MATLQDSVSTAGMNVNGIATPTSIDDSRSNIRTSVYHDSLSDSQSPFTQESASSPNSPTAVNFLRNPVEARMPNGEPAEQTATAPVDQPSLQNGGMPNGPHLQNNNHDPMELVITLLRATIRRLAQTDFLTEGLPRDTLIRIMVMLQGLLQLDATMEKTDQVLRRFSGELFTVSLSVRPSATPIPDDIRSDPGQSSEGSSEASVGLDKAESVIVPAIRRTMEYFNLRMPKDLMLIVVVVVLWSVGMSSLAVIVDRTLARRH